jgi:hypothetical protein
MGSVDDECSGMNDKLETRGVDVSYMDDLVLTITPEADIVPRDCFPVCNDPGLKPVRGRPRGADLGKFEGKKV